MDVESEIRELKRRVGDLEGAVSLLAGQFSKVHPEVIAQGAIPGATLIVRKGEAIEFEGAFGFRSLEPDRSPMRLETVFDLSSLTKPFATAVAVMILTRDGKLRPPKIGLLDYVIGIAREPEYKQRLYVVPVAVNYDRVLEDRSLLLELAKSEGKKRPPRMSQMADVFRFVLWNLTRLATRQWRRYGRAAVLVGKPFALAPWFDVVEGLIPFFGQELLVARKR